MSIKEITITEQQLSNIKEDDLLCITTPGRMGDIYGCSIVVKNNNKIIFYRIDNLYEFKGNIYEKFPIWNKSVKEYFEKKDNNTYKIINMGFGNLLAINKSIIDKFIPLVKEKTNESNDEFIFGRTCYTYWKEIINNIFNKD